MLDWPTPVTGWVSLQEPLGWAPGKEALEGLSAQGVPRVENACKAGCVSTRLDGNEDGSQPCDLGYTTRARTTSHNALSRDQVSLWQSGAVLVVFTTRLNMICTFQYYLI